MLFIVRKLKFKKRDEYLYIFNVFDSKRNLWSKYFTDASSTLIEIFTIVKANKLDAQTSDPNKNTLINATGALINRLNEYGDYFDKYMKTTRSFSGRDGEYLDLFEKACN